MDLKDLFGQRRRLIDAKSEIKKPKMDPYLEELLASANADHVFQGGTGNFDLLIESLTNSLSEPNNAPFFPQIQAAIRNLESKKEVDPIRADTRKKARRILGNLGEDFLGPRGPMELE